MPRPRLRLLALACGAILSVSLTAQAGFADPVSPPPVVGKQPGKARASQSTDTLLVTLDRAQADPAAAAEAAVARVLDAGVEVTNVSPVTATTASVTIDRTLSADESAELGAQVSDVAGVRVAEPAATFRPTTNDAYYSYLWNLHDNPYGVDAPGAWAYTGGSKTVIGVVDTGITAHKDLTGSSSKTSGGNIVKGYDFISDVAAAGDGNGRDSSPADAGDYCVDTGDASSWHGTHVAGIAAAIGSNKRGVVGVAPKAKVQPLRVLGRCGGAEADLAAAIRWGAGLPVVGLPTNKTPSSVLNMSLGAVDTPCSALLQDAINASVGAGVPVVVSTGNEGNSVASSSPANCQNVIRVAASTSTGGIASYSNYGTSGLPVVSAPGGEGGSFDLEDWIISTWNTGTKKPKKAAYGAMAGTSMAAPHVAAVVALLQSVDASLTPAQLATVLNQTVSPLPSCDTTTCGPGVVNAAAAVATVAQASLDALGQATISGTVVQGGTLTAALSAKPARGVSLSYRWLRNGVDIKSATKSTYKLTAADLDQAVTVRITGKIGPKAAERVSAAIHPVLLAFSRTVDPSVTGTATVGKTLKAKAGTWSPTPSTVSYRWLRDGVDIKSATKSSYKLTKSDRGRSVSVRVTVSRTGYVTTNAVSAAVVIA